LLTLITNRGRRPNSKIRAPSPIFLSHIFRAGVDNINSIC
jgi:hypothetical protein